MKLPLFLIATILFFSLWSALFEPYETKKGIKDAVAEAEFVNFVSKKISVSGVESELSGSLGEKFSDRVTVYDMIYKTFTPKKESLKAKKGVYNTVNEIIDLYGDVFYEGKEFIFLSDRARYAKKTETFRSLGPFSMKGESFSATGTDLIYYRNKGKILAKSVKATIKEKKGR